MALTLDQVRHVAKLARLSLSPEEEQKTLGQLQQILDAVKTLEAVDTKDVPPTYQVNLEGGFLRPDVPKPPLPVDEALKNAPKKVGDHFAVPRIIE